MVVVLVVVVAVVVVVVVAVAAVIVVVFAVSWLLSSPYSCFLYLFGSRSSLVTYGQFG